MRHSQELPRRSVLNCCDRHCTLVCLDDGGVDYDALEIWICHHDLEMSHPIAAERTEMNTDPTIIPTADESAISEDDALVEVRRQWNDSCVACYWLSDISNLRWSEYSGGVRARAPRPFVHGYVSCARAVDGSIVHSCRHGPPRHCIKICITKKGNEQIWQRILRIVGPRPAR